MIATSEPLKLGDLVHGDLFILHDGRIGVLNSFYGPQDLSATAVVWFGEGILNRPPREPVVRELEASEPAERILRPAGYDIIEPKRTDTDRRQAGDIVFVKKTGEFGAIWGFASRGLSALALVWFGCVDAADELVMRAVPRRQLHPAFTLNEVSNVWVRAEGVEISRPSRVAETLQ